MWAVKWLTVDHQLILLIGNYMNGTGVKGGAFGFRVSSINRVRMSDTTLDDFILIHRSPSS